MVTMATTDLPFAAEAALWHPVLLSRALGAQPLAAQLLTQALVLWRDDQGVAHAWADQCPHRGARLSLGRVCEGRLECPYHGWQFDGAGQCQLIPGLPGFSPPAGHRAPTFEAYEAYGLLWVRLAPGHAALPLFAADADERLRKVNCGPYTVQSSAPRIVENFLDLAHFGFVHEGWLGSRDATAVPPYDVRATPTGVLATGCKAVQPRSSVHATASAMVEYTYQVISPYCAVLTKMPQAGTAAIEDLRESIALFICPVGPETSEVWIRLAVNDFDSPDHKLTDFQDTIFGQDKPVLESQRPKRLPLGPGAELHCAADKMAVMYRRFLAESGIRFGVC
jgi:phenylpropionate dioxygenase-like ring-hydroxylating dioxygenase large terminal subunit